MYINILSAKCRLFSFGEACNSSGCNKTYLYVLCILLNSSNITIFLCTCWHMHFSFHKYEYIGIGPKADNCYTLPTTKNKKQKTYKSSLSWYVMSNGSIYIKENPFYILEYQQVHRSNFQLISTMVNILACIISIYSYASESLVLHHHSNQPTNPSLQFSTCWVLRS